MKVSSRLLGLFFGLLSGCATTTEGGVVGANRGQLLLVPSGQITQASAEEYEKIKAAASSAGKLDRNPNQVQRVQGIAKNLIEQTIVFRKDAKSWAWESHVLTGEELNAYCMPGGKIMFYSGIIEKLNLTDSEIAAIMGHEMAHALREHGRESISEELIKNVGITAFLASGKVDRKYADALALASTLVITLPHSRAHESEADDIGVELMARAGYDPKQAVSLWRKMAAQGGGEASRIFKHSPRRF